MYLEAKNFQVGSRTFRAVTFPAPGCIRFCCLLLCETTKSSSCPSLLQPLPMGGGDGHMSILLLQQHSGSKVVPGAVIFPAHLVGQHRDYLIAETHEIIHPSLHQPDQWEVGYQSHVHSCMFEPIFDRLKLFLAPGLSGSLGWPASLLLIMKPTKSSAILTTIMPMEVGMVMSIFWPCVVQYKWVCFQ
jgi:hypothetical protein